MPGAVAKTSTLALTNVTAPYALQIANKGIVVAAKENPTILTGINLINHQITYQAVAKAHGFDYTVALDVM